MVVSSRASNVAKPDVIIMAVTSQLHAMASLGEVWIVDWQMTNLLKPSAIKPVFATLEQNLIIRRLGALQAQDQSALRAAIATILAKAYGSLLRIGSCGVAGYSGVSRIFLRASTVVSISDLLAVFKPMCSCTAQCK